MQDIQFDTFQFLHDTNCKFHFWIMQSSLPKSVHHCQQKIRWQQYQVQLKCEYQLSYVMYFFCKSWLCKIQWHQNNSKQGLIARINTLVVWVSVSTCFQKVIIKFNWNFCHGVAEFQIMSCSQCLWWHVVLTCRIKLISFQKFQKLMPWTKDFYTSPENSRPTKNMLMTEPNFIVYEIEPLQHCFPGYKQKQHTKCIPNATQLYYLL